MSATKAPDLSDRIGRLTALLKGIDPWDERERADLAEAVRWIRSGAPIYRTRRPNVPPMHLVSYFVALDETRKVLLLVAHRKAELWLPSGGHVEPGEDPWETVLRECREELHIPATASDGAGDRPFFLTITETRGPGRHTDVSLWCVLRADAESITSYDEEEFAAIKWVTPQQVLEEPIDLLDPHMHRFAAKLVARLSERATRRPGGPE